LLSLRRNQMKWTSLKSWSWFLSWLKKLETQNSLNLFSGLWKTFYKRFLALLLWVTSSKR
jgi:hypothetical protein